MSTGEEVAFNTDIISLTDLVDSVFNTGAQDSLRSVTKTIRVNNGNTESKNLTEYNIKEDLDKLKDYNVATPRWADFMNTSTKDSAGLSVVTYTTENERAPVRYIRIIKKEGGIVSAIIRSQKETMVSDQEMNIQWDLDSGYTIERTSQLLFRKPSVFQMEVRYR